MDCIFCKIINKEIPTDLVYEDEKFLVIKDIKPLAPIHLLLITKKHIPSVDHLAVDDKELIGELVLLAQKVAREQGVSQTGYKIGFNIGKGGGQIVNHLHLHLLGGWK
ncbi:Purine nucleoside phosphoramidase [subsurface metagenome]